MYTHFKRCYLCKMCIHFFGTLCICMKYIVILYSVQNLDDRGADIGHLLQRGMSKLRPVCLSENTAT